MNDSILVLLLSSIVAQAAPLVLAITGETITERAGVINLSLDGTLMLTAMTGFVVAFQVGNLGFEADLIPVLLGFTVAALLGGLIALLIGWGSIRLKRDQVAIGFVLTLLLADIANFMGQNFTRLPGPTVKHIGIPLLKDLPVVGPILFDHDLLIYLTAIVVALSWWWMYRTQPGLRMRGVGERPEAAFTRGVQVNRVRYLYTALGGALVGIAGASYSLDIKIGWSDNHTLGLGWIALAIVIFGGWHPVRGALGALLYGATRTLATYLQQVVPGVPVVLFNSLQWLLMLGVLLLVGTDSLKRLVDYAPGPLKQPLAQALRFAPPDALGEVFVKE